MDPQPERERDEKSGQSRKNGKERLFDEDGKLSNKHRFDPQTGQLITNDKNEQLKLTADELKNLCQKYPELSSQMLNAQLPKLERKVAQTADLLMRAALRGGGLTETCLDEPEIARFEGGEVGTNPQSGSTGTSTTEPNTGPDREEGGKPGGELPRPEPGAEPTLRVVLHTQAEDEIFIEMLRDVIRQCITPYDLSTPEAAKEPKPGLTDRRAAEDLLDLLETPGLRLLTLEQDGRVLGFYMFFVEEENFHHQAAKTVDALCVRREEQGREMPAGRLGYGAMVGLVTEARDAARRTGRNAMDMLHEAGVEVAAADGIAHMLGTIRTDPAPNVASFVAHEQRSWVTTSAATTHSIHDDKGTEATVVCVLLDIDRALKRLRAAELAGRPTTKPG